MTADEGDRRRDSTAGPVSLSATRTLDTVVITAAGELTATGSGLEVLRWVTGEVRHVVVDVAGLTFADVAGLRLLLLTRHDCVARGATFTLRAPTPYLRCLLDLTDTRDLLIADPADRRAG